jgi:hypothetical protein
MLCAESRESFGWYVEHYAVWAALRGVSAAEPCSLVPSRIKLPSSAPDITPVWSVITLFHDTLSTEMFDVADWGGKMMKIIGWTN